MKIKITPEISQEKPIFENRIWRIDDIVSFTGFSKGTIYNLTAKNKIPHRRKRGRLFFIPLEILNWIDEE